MNLFKIHARTLSEGFTQSEITEMTACFQKWNWRYNQLLVKPGQINFALLVGSIIHASLEEWYRTAGARVTVATLQFQEYEIPSLADLDKQQYWNALLPMMIEAYTIHYREDFINWDIQFVEKKVDMEFNGFRLRGMIDLKIKTGPEVWIVDHKTAGRLNMQTVAGWEFRFQFMFYIWLMSKIEGSGLAGYRVNVIKKTELRVKKNESLQAFAARVREDMIYNPDKYFYREKFPVNASALKHFEEAVLTPYLDKLAWLVRNSNLEISKALMIEKNTNECQKWGGAPCPYLELCRDGFDKMGFLYTNKQVKHEELTDDSEE